VIASTVPVTARIQFRRSGQLLVPVGFAILAFGMIFYGLGDGRARLIAAALVACVTSAICYGAAARLLPGYYAPRLLIVSYALQLLALVTIAGLGLPLGPPSHPFEINIGDAPIRAVLAIVAIPIGTVIVGLGWAFVSGLGMPRLSDAQRRIDSPRQRRPYLLVAAALQLLYWPAALLSAGWIAYAVRIAEGGLVVAPFVAGRDSRDDRGMFGVWCTTILLDAVVGIAIGARSKALTPGVLFVAGWISVLPKRRRLLFTVVGLLAAIPLVQLAGAVGVVRGEMGRDRVEMLQPDHIREVFARVGQEMTPGAAGDSHERNVQGVSRLLAWSNVVVPVMTPESVPYRGFDGFLEETLQTFRIARLSGLTPDDLYDAGLMSAGARPYGFRIDANTSVEFSLAADAWSRGGLPVAILFGILGALVLTLCESVALQLDRGGLGPASILLLPVARVAFFDANALPLLAVIRGAVLYLAATAVLLIAIEIVRQPVGNIQRRRSLELTRRRPTVPYSQ